MASCGSSTCDALTACIADGLQECNADVMHRVGGLAGRVSRHRRRQQLAGALPFSARSSTPGSIACGAFSLLCRALDPDSSSYGICKALGAHKSSDFNHQCPHPVRNDVDSCSFFYPCSPVRFAGICNAVAMQFCHIPPHLSTEVQTAGGIELRWRLLRAGLTVGHHCSSAGGIHSRAVGIGPACWQVSVEHLGGSIR